MAFNTRAFDAQDALVAALKDSEDLQDWSIDYGLPSDRNERHIWVDEQIDNWEQQPATSGLVSKDEAFRIAIYIYARQTDSSAKEVRDLIKNAANVISDLIGSTPFLGGVVLLAEISTGEYDGAFADPEGRAREGVLKLTVGCSAFISGA